MAYLGTLAALRARLGTGRGQQIDVSALESTAAILENFTMFSDAGKGQNRLAVQSAISLANVLPLAHEAKIRQIAGIVDVCEMQWFGAYYKEPKNFFANFAVDHRHMKAVFDDYHMNDADFQAFANDRQGAIVGPELMKRFGWKVGDRITLKSTIFPMNPELNIRAVYEHPVDTSSLMFHMDYFQQALGDPGAVGMFWIKVKDRNNMTAISKQIDDMFRNSPQPTKTESEKAFQLSFIAMLGNVKAFILSICAAVVFAILLVAANTMAMSIRERTREVAMLKTLGFTRGIVLSLFVGEAVALSIAGGLLGVLIAAGLVSFVAHSPYATGILFGLRVSAVTMVVAVIVAAFVGFVSAYFPAYNASRVNIVEGLRHIG